MVTRLLSYGSSLDERERTSRLFSATALYAFASCFNLTRLRYCAGGSMRISPILAGALRSQAVPMILAFSSRTSVTGRTMLTTAALPGPETTNPA